MNVPWKTLRGARSVTILTLLCMAAPAATMAQSWPTRNITAIIPFAAGNANDVVARIVLDQLSRQLGHSIIIENRAGAGGTTGVAAAAKAAPDGYAILVDSSSLSASYSLYKSLPYDTSKVFAAVVPLGPQPTFLIAAPQKGGKPPAIWLPRPRRGR